MNTSHLKQWSLFYNSNNYLCLVHKVKDKIHIVNTNGTFYSVSKGINSNTYRMADEDDTPESFFMNFPVRILSDIRDKQRFEDIKSLYYAKSINTDKILLLL